MATSTRNNPMDDAGPVLQLRASTTSEETETDESTIQKKATLFHLMASKPWPFMIFWPVLFCCLIGFGWTRDDIIEDAVSNIWIPQSGDFANDVAYSETVGGAGGGVGATAYAAMAISRDNGNLFTKERLEVIRQRMEDTERTTVCADLWITL